MSDVFRGILVSGRLGHTRQQPKLNKNQMYFDVGKLSPKPISTVQGPEVCAPSKKAFEGSVRAAARTSGKPKVK